MTNYPIPHFVTRSIPHIKNPIPIDFSENNRNGARKLYTQKRYSAYQAGSRNDPTILRTKKQSVNPHTHRINNIPPPHNKHMHINGTSPHPLSTHPCPANRGHPHTPFKHNRVPPFKSATTKTHHNILVTPTNNCVTGNQELMRFPEGS